MDLLEKLASSDKPGPGTSPSLNTFHKEPSLIRLLKYLKPYSFFILAAIIMLFIQANADLALPDYMSRIVNIGIQQEAWKPRFLPSSARAV